MGDFLGIMLSIIFYLTPKEVESVQMWPYAGDTNVQRSKLSLTFRRGGTGWCPEAEETNQTRCITIADGKWVDEHGAVLLDIKGNLKVTHGTNYLFRPKDWENPLEFSVGSKNTERTYFIKSNGKVVREIKIQTLKSNQHSGANGEQPVGSETNRTSSAAAPRRSP